MEVKYPALITYKKSGDGGKELRYTLRSLSNLTNFSGRVIIAGNTEPWLENVTHIPCRRTSHNPYLDAEYKILEALTSEGFPNDFIYINDDTYITEKMELKPLHGGQLERKGSGYHHSQKEKTKEWLEENGYTTLDYDIHTPMLMNKVKRLEVHNLIKSTFQGISLKPRSIYGNIFSIGGEEYTDAKTKTAVLPKAPIISTQFYTDELRTLFPKTSKFEHVKDKPVIAALLHYYIEQHGSGGEMYAHNLLKEIAKTVEVHAYITDDKGKDTTIDGVHVHYNGLQAFKQAEHDAVITHFAQTRNALSQPAPVVQIIHNDKLPTFNLAKQNKGLLIYNSQWIKDKFKLEGLVLHPPIKEVKAKRGNKVLLVNLIPDKGSETFFELAKRMPHIKFLGVRGGYYKDKQETKELPNLEIVENTLDMDSIYSQTKVALMPSSYESYGMVAAEAAKAGIPTICQPTAGLKENLVEAGIYIDRKDVDAYERELDKLYKDKAYYKERSDLAKQRAEEHKEQDNIQSIVKSIVELAKGY